MGAIKKKYLLPVLLMLLLYLSGCGSNGNSSQSASDGSFSTNSISTGKGFSYNTTDETYTEAGINAKYPRLVNASDNKKAASINKTIQNDIRTYLDGLKAESRDSGKLTLDLKYEISGYKDKVLSITYTGLSSIEGAAYPVNVYHTLNISLDSTDSVALKSLFNIDSSFVQRFISGMYSPYTQDLNLEKSGVDIKGEINRQYSEQDLIKAFSAEKANYRLTDQGVIISVEVPHAMGDHLEMAINYEYIEGNMVKKNPVWKDYLFIIGPDDKAPGTSVKYETYSNARFGYQLSYPDVFTKSMESDNGDGVSMESADGTKTLKIWGSYNIDNSTGKTLLEDAKTRVSEISSEASDDQFYSIDYEGGGNGQTVLFHECGFISGGTVIGYVIFYPEKEKDSYSSVIDHMTKELKAIRLTK